MSTPFERLAEVDPLVHTPGRLAILTALSACEEADFTYLRRITGLTDGNLGSHLTRLADAEMVEIDKEFDGRRPRTTLRLLPAGREAIEGWWTAVEGARADVDRWRSSDP